MAPRGAVLAVVVLTVVAGPARADDWVGPDKALHAGVSAALVLGAHAAAIPLVDAPLDRALLGVLTSLALGIGKELLDAFGLGTPSFKDLTWNVAGAGAGLLLAWALDVFVVTPLLERIAPRFVF
jgi:uncharacterized protein YfiM (DUF2279 family)